MKQELSENEVKKEYLRGYERAVRQMKRHEERMRELRLNRLPSGINMDGMPHAHNNSDLSAYAAMLDQEEELYMQARYQRIQKCKEITDKIECMKDEDEKDVLVYRYIRLMKWEDICVKLNISWKQVHRVHARALNSFQIDES